MQIAFYFISKTYHKAHYIDGVVFYSKFDLNQKYVVILYYYLMGSQYFNFRILFQVLSNS